MADDKPDKSTTRWKIITGIAIAALIAGIIFYSFKSGLMVSKVSVPGMVELEFAERQGLGSVTKSEETDNLALRENQARLESKLAELVDRLPRYQAPAGVLAPLNKPPPSGSVAAIPAIYGQWFSPQGLTYIIQQRGNYITIQEMNPLLGITAVGEGTIQGQQINISYTTAAGTFGQAALSLSNDGRTMWGQSRDTVTGFVMNMQLQH